MWRDVCCYFVSVIPRNTACQIEKLSFVDAIYS